MIWQEELGRYLKLVEQSKEAERQVQAVRASLLAGLDDGVEPGPYDLKVDDRETRSFSYVSLVDAVGRAEADRLKEMMPVSRSRVLRVVAR